MAILPDPDREGPRDSLPEIMTPDVMQRLKTGVGGLLAVIVTVGIAHIITASALQTEETVVSQAAAPVEPDAAAKTGDPLTEAGVVPDLPEQAEEEPVPEGPVLPETGEGTPVE
ncbi:hypothetical protein [Alteriqipengyuania sp.]|uniref:hypothetical protein n=1 Tax=Alteriqipengyuania sp. TaxID=2800692 RepID=UPI00351325DC